MVDEKSLGTLLSDFMKKDTKLTLLLLYYYLYYYIYVHTLGNVWGSFGDILDVFMRYFWNILRTFGVYL